MTQELSTSSNGETRAVSITYRRFIDPLLVALFASVTVTIGAANPSFWYDEAATISASNRTLSELAKLVTTTDSAHPFYYLLMNGWFRIVPQTEFWARAPSCIAVGIAAAGLVIMGKLLSTRTVAVSAGVIFGMLPRVTVAGIEARPYALSCAATVWLTVVLLLAVRRNSIHHWTLYSVVLTLGVMLHVYVVLMVLVHVSVLIILRANRQTWIALLCASCAAGVLLSPYLVFLMRQSDQLDWIHSLGLDTLSALLVNQYFEYSVPFAITAWLLLVSALLPRFRKHWRTTKGFIDAVLLSIAWMIVPSAIILGVSAIAKPLYVDRYLSFTAPAMALLLGLCVAVIGQKPAIVTLLVLALAASGMPNYVRQRGDYAKTEMDYSAVADLIAAKSSPGNCLLLDDTVDWQPGPIRPLVHARPGAYKQLVDVGAGRSAISMGALWDENIAPFRVSDRISRCSVIWTISQKDPALPAHELGAALPPGPRFSRMNAFWVPCELGFRLVERWQFNISQVTKAVR